MSFVDYLNLLFGLFNLLHIVIAFFLCRKIDYLLPRKNNKFTRLLFLLVLTFTLGMPAWVGDENPLFMLPVFFLAFFVSLDGPLIARGTLASIFYCFTISCNMMISTISLPFSVALYPLYDNFIYIFKAICWILFYLLLHRLILKGRAVQLSSKLWGLIGVLSLAPLASQLIFVVYNAKIFYPSDEIYALITRMAYTALPFVALSSLAMLFAISTLSRYQQLDQEQQLNQLNRSYYDQLERQQKQVRRLRHDMANHLQTLSALSGEERDAYLQQLLGSPGLQPTAKWSENRVANAVLAAKAEEMAAEHIRGDLSAPLPELLPFSDIDLCAVLANSLDNAIEACRKLPSPMQKINCKARVDKGMFLLRVVNPCPDEPVTKDGRFLTSKSDRQNHGLGLEGIRAIAEKYGGSFSAGLQDGDFELLLYLPLENRQSV